MCTRFSLFLLPAILAAAAAVWAADPLLAGHQSSAKANEDLVLGSWVLNVAKSKFYPGPPPKSQKRTYEAHEKGVKATIQTVYADGHSTTSQYVAAYDGVEYPLTGSPNSDGIAMKRSDPRTAEATITHAGKTMGTARRVISPDGKTMTITYRGLWDGKDSNNVAVYEKEAK